MTDWIHGLLAPREVSHVLPPREGEEALENPRVHLHILELGVTKHGEKLWVNSSELYPRADEVRVLVSVNGIVIMARYGNRVMVSRLDEADIEVR